MAKKSMKLVDAVKGYLLSRKSKCNEKTIGWYRQKLAHFCLVLEQEYKVTTLQDVTITQLRLFWCIREELIKKNPAQQLDNPKVSRYVIKTFTEDQIKAMLAALNISTVVGFRDYTIILLLLDTGIRISEMCSLTLDRVYLAVLNEAFIKVMGKGRKEREVGISAGVAQRLWKYIHVYRQPKDESNQALFINVFGESLTINGVEQMLKEVAKRANIGGVRVSPHTFRHTFARMFLENGGMYISSRCSWGIVALLLLRIT